MERHPHGVTEQPGDGIWPGLRTSTASHADGCRVYLNQALMMAGGAVGHSIIYFAERGK